MRNEHTHTASIGGPAAWKFNKRLKTPHHTKSKARYRMLQRASDFWQILYMAG